MRGFIFAAGASMLASSAWAQTAPSPRDSDAAKSDEIIVTAQRRTERLIDVPISITAINDAALLSRGIRSARDLQFGVPNFTTYSRTDANPDFLIRGISTGARNVGFESGLGVYVDGIYQGRSSAATQELDDIARVEVLRGPQGTLFGKNTTAGALNLVTHVPGNEAEGRVVAEYGNYDYARLGGWIAGPIVRDRIYGKFSAFGTRRDGFTANIFPGGPSRLDGDGSYGFRGELRFTPGDRLDISLRADWARVNRRQYENEVAAIVDNPLGLPLAGVVPGPRTVNVDGQNREKRTIAGGSVSAAYDLGSAQIVSLTALRGLKYDAIDGDQDFEPADYLKLDGKDELSQFTQEIRLASTGERRFTYLLGAFYFDQVAKSRRDFRLGTDLKTVLNALTGLTPDLLPDIVTSARVRTVSWAGFANLGFKITPAIELTGGARYTEEVKRLTVGQQGIPVLGIPDVPQTPGRLRSTDFSPTVGVNIRPAKDVLLYARYAKGFKSGGWNVDLLNTTIISDIRFRPESIENYEIGAKAELFERRLFFNLALFQLNYRNIQISRYNDVTAQFETTNAARARSRGFEFEATVKPLRGVTLSGALGYADAVYRRYPNAAPGIDLSGARLNAPRWTAGASAEYEARLSDDLSAFLRGDYSSRSSTPGDGIDPTSALPGFAVVDARIGLRSQKGWSLAAWGRNLTDKTYITDRFTGGNLVTTLGVVQLIESYGRPRTYGVTLSYDF